MTTQTISQDYQIRGNPARPVLEVGDLIYNDLGQLALAKLNEKFRGNPNIAYQDLPEQNQPISFSNRPRALAINQILREETNNQIRVLSPEEVVQYWQAIPDKSATYADTNSVSVFPNQGPNETLRKRVLEILGKNSKNLEVPFYVHDLGVEPADNKYGFTFTETDYTKATEAPFLQKNQKVKYDPKTRVLVPSEDHKDVYIWTPYDQSGLRGNCRYGGGCLLFRDYDLLNSNSSGRVQVVKDPQGLAENLDELVNELQIERDKKIAETQTNYEKALKVLRTGKL